MKRFSLTPLQIEIWKLFKKPDTYSSFTLLIYRRYSNVRIIG